MLISFSDTLDKELFDLFGGGESLSLRNKGVIQNSFLCISVMNIWFFLSGASSSAQHKMKRMKHYAHFLFIIITIIQPNYNVHFYMKF